MPVIVEYDDVVNRMLELNMRSQYFNSGAFGFDAGVVTYFTGWIGGDDPSIRPEALLRARKIDPPIEMNLAQRTTTVWRELLPGNIWVMPKSNWAYELDFGSKTWMPEALRAAGINPAELNGRTNAPAIEFAPNEAASFTPFLQTLLENLFGSDFALAFPGHAITCTVHHHKQLWWVSDDEALIDKIQQLSISRETCAE